jgi:hypothetical protein
MNRIVGGWIAPPAVTPYTAIEWEPRFKHCTKGPVMRRTILVWALALAVSPACVLGAEKPSASGELADHGAKYMRVTRDKKGTVTGLETAIVRFAPRDCGRTGPAVDLVAAVHIGDKAYYDEINREFDKYDVVLYELVAPPGTRVPEGGKGSTSSNPVGMTQGALKDILALEFQLERVRYNRPNMVHADMSPDQLVETMKKRGESIMTMVARAMGYSIARQKPDGGMGDEFQMISALFSRNRPLALKRVMAQQMEDMGDLGAAFGGSEGSTLIEERNKVALDILRKQIKAGKKKIAVFYGGGHMPDFDKRLRADFDMVPVETRWLVAWNTQEPQSKESGLRLKDYLKKPPEKKKVAPAGASR